MTAHDAHRSSCSASPRGGSAWRGSRRRTRPPRSPRARRAACSKCTRIAWRWRGWNSTTSRRRGTCARWRGSSLAFAATLPSTRCRLGRSPGRAQPPLRAHPSCPPRGGAGSRAAAPPRASLRAECRGRAQPRPLLAHPSWVSVGCATRVEGAWLSEVCHVMCAVSEDVSIGRCVTSCALFQRTYQLGGVTSCALFQRTCQLGGVSRHVRCL